MHLSEGSTAQPLCEVALLLLVSAILDSSGILDGQEITAYLASSSGFAIRPLLSALMKHSEVETSTLLSVVLPQGAFVLQGRRQHHVQPPRCGTGSCRCNRASLGTDGPSRFADTVPGAARHCTTAV